MLSLAVISMIFKDCDYETWLYCCLKMVSNMFLLFALSPSTSQNLGNLKRLQYIQYPFLIYIYMWRGPFGFISFLRSYVHTRSQLWSWARFPRLWSYFCPLHVFVVCCWGGKVVPFRAWSKSSLTLISLLWMPFIISSCCNLGERVCSCLLLLGWKGCRLVYLFAVARVQGLAQALFRRLGSSAPPPFTSLTSPSWRIFIYLFMGRKRVLFCQSRRQVSSENHVFPFVRCVFHLMSLFPM